MRQRAADIVLERHARKQFRVLQEKIRLVFQITRDRFFPRQLVLGSFL